METEKVRFVGGILDGKYIEVPINVNRWEAFDDSDWKTFDDSDDFGLKRVLYSRKAYFDRHGYLFYEFHLVKVLENK